MLSQYTAGDAALPTPSACKHTLFVDILNSIVELCTL